MLLKIRNEKGEWVAVDVIKGEPGADGYTPIKGVDYRDGVDGKDGYTPVKGVDYFDGKDGLPGKDGKDGYTPIKGIDYRDGFDGTPGRDGYTPIKGVDYFDGKNGRDGKDGYTPIKGIDYFDGAPGKDGTMTFEELTEEQKASLKGEPGKDGYTPVKGIDYFDGKDGAPGKDGVDGVNGVDGKDYILTDADKQEIAAMVEVTGGGEGGKDSFFIDFTNATGENQACDNEMLEFIEYFQENDDCCINIRDGLNSEAGAGYYYPGLIQTTDKTKSINILKAVINLNTVNNVQQFRIYNLNKVNGSWFYKWVIGTYNYQLVTSKNVNNFLTDYYTKEEIDSLLANMPAGDIPSGEGVEF